MSVLRGPDVDPLWREPQWSEEISAEKRPLGALILKEGDLKPPAEIEMHLPESSELQVRYFQRSMGEPISLKYLPCPESASTYYGLVGQVNTFQPPTPGSLCPLGLCFVGRVTICPSLTGMVPVYI